MAQRDYFKNKRVAIIGLGAHGEMVADIKFLIKAGAIVSLYDLRSEAVLKSHLVFLRSVGLVSYVCGSIPEDDLLDMDIVILSQEYPRDSSFLHSLKEKNIIIEYPESLFFRLAPPITFVGIMGECGKSTVMSMLTPVLELACTLQGEQKLFTIDPDSADGVLANLKKIKSGDILLVRMTDRIVKELFELRISPHVAIFTTLSNNNVYSDNPLEILSFQTYNNFIIANDEIIDLTHTLKVQSKAKMLRTKKNIIPNDWEFSGNRSHDRDNASLVLQTARLFKVADEDARQILESWKALKGHLELVKKVKGIDFYNDSASTSPLSTLLALENVAHSQKVILIFGGVDCGKNYKIVYEVFPKYVSRLILLPGSGTLRERRTINNIKDVDIHSAVSIEDAVKIAMDNAKKGDIVLFSPGFEAGGFDHSRKDRGERFVRIVRVV